MHTLQPGIRLGSTLALLVLLVGCNSAEESGQAVVFDPARRQISRNRLSDAMIGPIRYVALGDSTGAGVGARYGGYVARLFKRVLGLRPDSTLTNLCVSGATTSDVFRGQLDAGVRSNPQIITLGIGINDIGHGVSLEQFSKNYEQILRRLKRDTKAAIVVANLPDISTAPRIPHGLRDEYHQQIVAFNQRLEEIASQYEVTVFDIYTVTHEQLSTHPEFFSEDGFHPSDKGYEFWAEQMWPVIGLTIGLTDPKLQAIQSRSPGEECLERPRPCGRKAVVLE